MNLFDRAEIWLNCRKIELSAWLKDSKKSYTTRYNPETGEYSTVGCQSFKPGTPEGDQIMAEWNAKRKAYLEREAKLCALDPAYKAMVEKRNKAHKAEADDRWRRSGKSDEEIARVRERLARLK